MTNSGHLVSSCLAKITRQHSADRIPTPHFRYKRSAAALTLT